MTPPTLVEARVHRDGAKERLRHTAALVGRKLNPRVMAHDAVESARDRVVTVADGAAEQVRKRPGVFAAGLALVAALLARRRIVRRRKAEQDDATAVAPESYSV